MSLGQKKAALAAVAFLAVLFLGWKTVLQKDIQTLRKFHKEIKVDSRKRALLQENIASVDRIKVYDPFFSKTRQSDWLAEAVSRMAAESGLTVVYYTPQNLRDDPKYPK